jgi:hypothetical protein
VVQRERCCIAFNNLAQEQGMVALPSKTWPKNKAWFLLLPFWALCRKELGVRPHLHEWPGPNCSWAQDSMFWPNNWTPQNHKFLYYFYELGLSHVNLFDSGIGPKSYLISFFLSLSFFFTLVMQEFHFVFFFFFFVLHFLTLFFFVLFLKYFYVKSHFLFSFLFNFYISFFNPFFSYSFCSIPFFFSIVLILATCKK